MGITIIIRSRNNEGIIAQTLKGVFEQTLQDFEVVNFDNSSTDSTLEKIKPFNTKTVIIPEGSYVPGRVLNLAVEESSTEIVVFLNSDCVPLNKYWLENLIKPFADPAVGAVFSRQVAVKEALPIIQMDIERAFGEGKEHKKWGHFFSMASSAIRRSVWVEDRFDESMLISEDLEWSSRIKKKGFKVLYAKDSIVVHHHNYSLRELYHRHVKEGIDSVKIFAVRGSTIVLLMKVFLYPLLVSIIRDTPVLLKNFSWRDVVAMPVYRLVLYWGRFKGTKWALDQIGRVARKA